MKNLITRLLFSVFCSALISPAFGAADREALAQALNWPAKWTSVIERTSGKYLERVARSDLAKLPGSQRQAALTQLRRQIGQELSWSTMGRRFTRAMSDACSDGVLNDMVRIKRRELTGEPAQRVLNNYRGCASDGFGQAMRLLGYRFKELLPSLRQTISQYQKQAGVDTGSSTGK